MAPVMASPFPIPATRVRAGDIHLAVEVGGASRRPLVLVHGYCGSRLDFSPVRSALVEDRRVIAYDQRGHGESDRRAPYSVALLARDLEALLDALGEREVDLLGHSLGGMVALRFALARPRRVRSLILVGTTAEPCPLYSVPPAEVGAIGRAKLELRFWLRLDAARAAARSLRASGEARDRFEAVVRYGHRKVDRQAAHQLGADFGRVPSVLGELGRFDGPALVLVGAEDHRFLEPSRALAAGLPGGRLVVLAGADHDPQVEASEAWLSAVRDHLAAP